MLGNEPLPHRREDAQVFLTDVPRGTFIRGPSRTVRRADALAWMAERLFESGDAPALAPDRHEIVVHVEAEVLADGRAGRCEIEHRTAIAAETARRLCCDAGIVPAVDGPQRRAAQRWAAPPAASRRRCAARSRTATTGAASPAAPPPTGFMAITSSTGPTAARPHSTTSSFCVRPITGWCTRGGFDVQRLDDGAFRFVNPHGLAITPPRRRETSSPDTIVIQNESFGLAIDCETATAHWHGERIDYDHALMVTMASWDSGDTAPEAGPVAGDWNSS